MKKEKREKVFLSCNLIIVAEFNLFSRLDKNCQIILNLAFLPTSTTPPPANSGTQHAVPAILVVAFSLQSQLGDDEKIPNGTRATASQSKSSLSWFFPECLKAIWRNVFFACLPTWSLTKRAPSSIGSEIEIDEETISQMELQMTTSYANASPRVRNRRAGRWTTGSPSGA